MAKYLIKQNATSVLAEVFAQDSSKSTGAGLAGVAYNTSGIAAYYFREGDASATAITLATMTIGTWATGGLILVDDTHMTGLLQLGLPNACFTALGSVVVYIYGVTNLAPIVMEFQVVAFDPKDAVHLGLSALPNTACTSNASLITSGNGTDQLTVSGGIASSDAKKINAVSTSNVTTVNSIVGLTDQINFTGTGASALVKSNAVDIGGTAQTGRDLGASVLLSNGTGTGQILLSSGAVTVGTNNDKTGYSLTVTPPTAAQNATAVWQDTTAGDFTVAGSIGKSLYTSGNAPGAASGIALVGSNMGTVTSVSGAVGSVTGNVGGNVVGSVGSVTGAVGSVTGNVGGSVATVTGAVGSVTGNVGGNVVGSVASVSAAVTVGTNNDKTGYALSAAGLDSIAVTDPGGVASMTTLPKMMVALWRRFFKKTTLDASNLKTYADNGSSVNTTQAASDNGSVQELDAAT